MSVFTAWDKRKKAVIIFLFIIALLFSGCATEENAWKAAVEENTIESYENYIEENPGGKYIQEALEAKEKAVWLKTKETNIILNYVRYLDDYPEGMYAEDAMWKIASLSDKIEDYERYLTKHPEGQYAEQALAKLVKVFSDGQLTILLNDIEITDSMPQGILDSIQGISDLGEGNLYACVDFQITQRKGIHSVQLKTYSTYSISIISETAFFSGGIGIFLVDLTGNQYWPKIIWVKEGVSIGDRTNITRSYNLDLTPVVAVFEIPEHLEFSSMFFEYTYQMGQDSNRLDDGQIIVDLH